MPDTQTPMAVTDATFAEVVERSPIPVLLNAWATWCRPCQRLAPVIEELVTELGPESALRDWMSIKTEATASQLKVRTVPTLLFFNKGREIDRMIGVQPKFEIAQRLERAIEAA
jgi:thioredoxin